MTKTVPVKTSKSIKQSDQKPPEDDIWKQDKNFLMETETGTYSINKNPQADFIFSI